jgi:hypothetical protein
LVLLIIVYTLSSTKFEVRAKQFLLRSEGIGRRGRGCGWGEVGRNDPNIVCMYE